MNAGTSAKMDDGVNSGMNAGDVMAGIPGVYAVTRPAGGAVPLVLDSPHSGNAYPADFRHRAAPEILRRSEDMYVDALFAGGVVHGAGMLSALFPRNYIDPNRSLADIDPALLAGDWPGPIVPSEKTRLGHGLIWRLCPSGQLLYEDRLAVSEVQRRIERFWQPYHRALAAMLDEAHGRFGAVWHLNCHSMPSDTQPGGAPMPDFVLGDRNGATCAPAFRDLVRDILVGFGYRVVLNNPYRGMEIVRLHGRPAEARHSLQIEINRALYMDERSFAKRPGFMTLRRHMEDLVRLLGRHGIDSLGARAAE